MQRYLSAAVRNYGDVFARRAPRSGARNVAGGWASIASDTPGHRYRELPRTPAACEDLAISFTGGCALRAYPRLHSCTAPRCPRANTWSYLRKAVL